MVGRPIAHAGAVRPTKVRKKRWVHSVSIVVLAPE